jgi:hypothetical protein
MGRMMDELGKILEGSGSGLNELLSRNLYRVQGRGVMTKSAKNLGLPAEIPTERVPNTNA